MDLIRDRMIGPQRDIRRIYDRLVAGERAVGAERRALRRHRLATQLDFARSRSAHVAAQLGGVSTERLLADPQAWSDVPITDKSTLLENFDALTTRSDAGFAAVDSYLRDRSLVDEPFPVEDLLVVSTAGTSGKAGYFVYDPLEQSHIRAQYFRFLRALLTHVAPTGPVRSAVIIVTGAHMIGYKMQRGLPPEFFRMIPVIRDGRSVPIEDIAAELVEFDPHVLTCFGSALAMLSEHKLLDPTFTWAPSALINTGATLDPSTKALAEQVFGGARVFDLYGSTDTGYLAWTCERGSMHFNTDCVDIEILDDDDRPVSPGETGSIVLTSLWHRTLPLVRYRLGDRVAAAEGTCECGRTLPLVQSLQGRENTLLYRRTESGLTPVPQGVFLELFENLAGVKRFRIEQWAPDDVRVEVVPLPVGAEGLADRVKAEMSQVFGPLTTVAVTSTEQLTLPASGKFMPVVRHFDARAVRATLT